MRKKVFVFVIISIISTMIIGCTEQSNVKSEKIEAEELKNQIKRYEENIKELEEKNKKYELKVKQLEEEKDEYKNFIDKAIEYLNENKLLELAKSEWNYKIQIDGKPIPSDGKIEINKDKFKIIYSEEQSLLSSIQEKIHNKGQISGDYFEHLKIVGIEPNNIATTDGTIVTSFIYEFENLPRSTSFTLEISDELKERLDLQTNTINIQVK